MARQEDTLWMPENIEITDLASGTKVQWPGTDASGDFRGRPDDQNTPASYLDSAWLSRINRFFGRVFNARGAGQLSDRTTVAEMASAVSPHWIEGGSYLAGDTKNYKGTQYYCLQNHTANTTNAPDVEGAPWVEYELYQRDRAIPLGYIYLNKTDSTNPGALANPWPGTWSVLPPNYYLGVSGDRYALDTLYKSALPNITGAFNADDEGIGLLKGAFYHKSNESGPNGSAGGIKVGFSAHLSNSIYQDNHDYVTPDTLGVAGFVKTAFAY